jgi:hypothetical protein
VILNLGCANTAPGSAFSYSYIRKIQYWRANVPQGTAGYHCLYMRMSGTYNGNIYGGTELEFLRIGTSVHFFVNRHQNSKRRNKGEGFFCEISRQNKLESRPVIGPLQRAITEPGGSFLLVLGPALSALLTNSALLTADVGK